MYLLTRGAMLLSALIMCLNATAQSIGIGTDVPIATLDVRTTDSQISLNVDRQLDNPSGSTAAFAIADDSDWSAMEVTQNDLLNSKEAVHVVHDGLGDGILIEVTNTASGADGLQIETYSNSQHAILNNMFGTSAWGVLNVLDASGVGVYNLCTDNNGVSVYTDMEAVTGSGYFFTNIDLSEIPSPTTGGDGFALDVFVNTQTASVGSTVYGAVIGGDQYGPGHGMIINHNGTGGRDAEFNITNAANASPVIFATSAGTGSVVYAQQNNSAIGSAVNVGSFQYSGTESLNHRAVYGYSAPAVGFGIGGDFTGDSYGVIGRDAGNAISGVHAVGNMSATGTKSFMIDHPLDPANAYLRHFAIESNEVLNMYRGTVVIPRSGKANVSLPEYFSSINVNVTYQLTPIGTSTQPWVAEEVNNNRFVIGGVPGSKVSWTIHANRNDAFVRSNPDKVSAEFKKTGDARGKYLDPVSHGLDESMSIYYNPPQELKASTRDRSAAVANGRTHHERSRAAVEEKSVRPEVEPRSPERMEILLPVKTMDEIH